MVEIAALAWILRPRSVYLSVMAKDRLQAAQLEYLDNADYSSAGSVAKAQVFEVACRKLLLLQHSEASQGGQAGAMQKIDTSLIQAELTAVQDWLLANGDSETVGNVFPDFSNFRG